MSYRMNGKLVKKLRRCVQVQAIRACGIASNILTAAV